MAENTLQTILNQQFEQYASSHTLRPHTYSAANRFMACRTAKLGGHIQACPNGHVQKVWYNSCRHRSCPQCNGLATERWLEKQKDRLLDTPHHHLVFTIPHEFNVIWQLNTTEVMSLMFKTIRDLLMELLGDFKYLGATPGFICAFHSWGRDQSIHPHVHCLITDGGLTTEGNWVTPKKSHFLPARVLMIKFRGRFIDYLQKSVVKEELKMPRDLQGQRFNNLCNKLGVVKKWNVHIQERYEHGQGVVTYLARYVKGGPFNLSQLKTDADQNILFRYIGHRQNSGGGSKQISYLKFKSDEFIRRLLVHIPDKGVRVVRSYGLYAAAKTDALDSARETCGQLPVDREIKPISAEQYLQRLGLDKKYLFCSECCKPLIITSKFEGIRGPPS